MNRINGQILLIKGGALLCTQNQVQNFKYSIQDSPIIYLFNLLHSNMAYLPDKIIFPLKTEMIYYFSIYNNIYQYNIVKYSRLPINQSYIKGVLIVHSLYVVVYASVYPSIHPSPMYLSVFTKSRLFIS